MGEHEHKYIISTYYPEWCIFKRKYMPCQIPAHKLTHINYAFAKIAKDGELIFSKQFLDNVFKTPNAPNKAYGLCEQMRELKSKNQNLKICLCVGGGSGSEILSEVLAHEESRNTIIKSCLEAVSQYGFDGIDLDWEYPTTKEDGVNLALFINILRKELDNLTKEINGEHFIISIAINSAAFRINALNIQSYHQSLDFVNIMGYDYHGPWTKHAGHHSSLFTQDDKKKSTCKAVDLLISLGVPKNKIVLGVPFYGRAFNNTDGIGCPHSGNISGTWEDNIFDYNTLPLPDSEEFYCPSNVAAHSYDSTKKILITYDNPESIKAKLDYIIENKLGGIMSWSINSDHPSGHPRCLTDIMYEKLRDNIDCKPRTKLFIKSKYSNICK